MHTMRRGGALFASAPKPRGIIRSRSGSAKVTPAPRRNDRRDIRWVAMLTSLVQEEFALHHGMDQRAQAILLLARPGHDLFDRVAVAVFQPVPGRVHHQLFGEGAGNLVRIL